MKKRIAALIFVIAMIFTLCGCEPKSDYDGPWWTQVGATSSHIGTLDTADFDMPGLGWVYRIPTGSHSQSTPIVVNGYVYFGSTDGYVYCLSDSKGKLKWSYKTEGAITNSPIYYNDRLYVASNDGYLYELDPVTGEFIDYAEINGSVIYNPVITDNGIFVCGVEQSDKRDEGIVAINLSTKKTIWTYSTVSHIVSDITYYGGGYEGGMVFFGAENAYYYALNATTGKLLWAFDTTNSSDLYGATVYDDKVYFGTGMGKLYCFNVYNENPDIIQPVWVNDCSGTMWVSGTPAIKDDCIVYGSYDGNVYCCDAQTGELKWRWPGVYWMTSGVTIIGNSVLIGGRTDDSKYYLFCLDFDTGEYRWSSQAMYTVRYAPSVVNGCIYYTDEMGQVIKLA